MPAAVAPATSGERPRIPSGFHGLAGCEGRRRRRWRAYRPVPRMRGKGHKPANLRGDPPVFGMEHEVRRGPPRRFKEPLRPTDPMGMRPGLMLWLLALGLASVGPGPGAHAEIYRWTDAAGRLHFTENLSQVPASQRRGAERSARRGAGRTVVNRVSPGAAAAPASARVRRPLAPGPFHIPYQPRGGAMLVMVRLNDRVTAPFLVDTGASDVSIPASVAARAGIVVGPDTPRALYTTANGVVSSPRVRIDAVQVGEARVEGVRGSINAGMEIGLLGGSFFHNFTLQIDPAAHVITLLRNDQVRSGASARQWRQRFGELQAKIRTLERYLSESHFAREGRRRELEQKLEALRGQLDALDTEADRAEVPQAWREGRVQNLPPAARGAAPEPLPVPPPSRPRRAPAAPARLDEAQAAAWRARRDQADRRLREAEAGLPALRRAVGWCHRGDGVYRTDELGMRHEVDCAELEDRVERLDEEVARLRHYLDEGLEEQCRRAGCLPGWIR